MKKQTVRVIRKSSLSSRVIAPSSPYMKGGARRNAGGTVQRIQRTLAIERNWRKSGTGPEGDQFKGYFHAAGMKFPGKATVSRTAIDIYIKDPPPELRRHRHWRCFFPRKDGWFWIHHTGQGGLDSAILEIEAILTECRPRHHSPKLQQQDKHHRPQTPSGGSVGKLVKFLTELFN